MLDRYATLSPKVHLDYVDPDKNPQAARAAGITKYGTTVVQIGAKKEEAKNMTEEDVTGAIIRDLKSNTRKVCFLTGGGERQIDDADRPGFSHLKDLLSKDDYTTKSISLLEKAEVPSDCTVVVVGGPKSDYQQPEVDALKKYVEGGGRAMFLLDPPLKIGRPTADNDALDSVLQRLGRQRGKKSFAGSEPRGPAVWSWSDDRSGLELRSAPHRERNERHRHGVSAVPVLDDQEHGQNDRAEAV